MGNEGWSYENLLPYYKRLEDFEDGESEGHGEGGPLTITRRDACREDRWEMVRYDNRMSILHLTGVRRIGRAVCEPPFFPFSINPCSPIGARVWHCRS